MKVGQLKTLIAAYLHKADMASFVKGTGAGEVDLLLVALNNARKKAERTHDFAACLKGGYYTVGANGINWQTAMTWWDASEEEDYVPQKVRKVRNWYLRTTGGIEAGEHGINHIIRATDNDTLVRAQAAQSYNEAYTPGRYPTDAQLESGYGDPLLGQSHIIIKGHRALFHPKPTTDQILTVDAYFWWPDWTDDDQEDWFTENGSEFLMYRGILELNKLLTVFVGNVEGNLPPPTKDMQDALDDLVATDEDSTDASQTLEFL